jgi:hypothetical protein
MAEIERKVFLSSFVMEYRGTEYIVEDVGPDTWTWTVDLNERITESGRQKTRESRADCCHTDNRPLAGRKQKTNSWGNAKGR